MRLVDADEVTSLMCGEVCGNLCGDYWGACQYKALRDAKTIDAPPVVRCKDCKYFLEDGDCFCENIEQYEHEKSVSPDWFCADGERRNYDN